MTVKVIIHLGGSMPGAASLRSWFKHNAPFLSKLGVFYPFAESSPHENGNADMVFDFTDDALLTLNRKKLEQLVAEAESVGATQLLLSSDIFGHYLKQLSSLVDNFQVIAYVGLPLHAAETSYRQSVKQGELADVFSLDEAKLCEELEQLRTQLNLVGASHFKLRASHRDCFYRNDLLSDFLHALGIKGIVTEALDLSEQVLASDALELKRWFNQFDTDLLNAELNDFLHFYSQNARPYTLLDSGVYIRLKHKSCKQMQAFLSKADVENGSELLSVLKKSAVPASLSQHLSDDLFAAMITAWLRYKPEVGFLLTVFVEQQAIQAGKATHRIALIKELITQAAYQTKRNDTTESKPDSKFTSGLKSFTSSLTELAHPKSTSSVAPAKQRKTVFNGVQWLSHHIPKVTESFLLDEYRYLWGSDGVHTAYQQSGAATLTRGELLEVENDIKVIHGHFTPHTNQKRYYPNARHAIWVRDPLERAWLLFQQVMDKHAPKPMYDKLKSELLDKGVTSQEALFEHFVIAPEWRKQVLAQSHYFENLKPEQFDFIGLASRFKKEFKVFSALATGYVQESNTVPNLESEIPPFVSNFKEVFKPEYEILGQILNRPS